MRSYTLDNPPEKCDVFLRPTPRGDHIFFVLTEPIEDKDGEKKVIVINISTVKKDRFVDDTCFVYPRSLPKVIKKKSFVEFRYAELVSVEKLENEDRANELKHRGKMSINIINIILDKLGEHPQVPDEVKNIL